MPIEMFLPVIHRSVVLRAYNIHALYVTRDMNMIIRHSNVSMDIISKMLWHHVIEETMNTSRSIVLMRPLRKRNNGLRRSVRLFDINPAALVGISTCRA